MWIVYKTTNLKSGKYYIGIHKQITDPYVFDGYYGSGLILNKAIEKYSPENFVRETLFVYETRKEAAEKEKEIVTPELLLTRKVYNLRPGGDGGDTLLMMSPERKQQTIEKRKETSKLNPVVYTDEQRKSMSEKAKKRVIEKPHTIPDNKGRKHHGEALQNMTEANTNRRGKYIFITNGIEETQHSVESKIPEGWRRGRCDEMVVALRSATHTSESRDKIANHPNIRGIKVYNNGLVNIKIPKGKTPPEGFFPGMIIKTKPMKWITDGIDTRQHDLSLPIPAGWRFGRTIKKKK